MRSIYEGGHMILKGRGEKSLLRWISAAEKFVKGWYDFAVNLGVIVVSVGY